MTPFLKTTSAVLITVFSIALHAQEAEESKETEQKKERFSIMIAAALGDYSNEGTNFSKIYPNPGISRIYVAGIGSNSFYIVAKYREFAASGRSIVENVDVAGKADWKQKFYSIGLRLHSDDHPFYAEVLYVLTRAEESITTENPFVAELEAKEKTENKGIGVSIGLAIKIAGPVKLFVEAEYSMMTRVGRNQYGRVNPELGGICFSGGVQFVL